LLLLAIATACGRSPADPTSNSTHGSGFEIPDNPYSPFPYASDVQREAFVSYIECAETHGISMEGPFADSRGKGVLLRIAPGEDVSPEAQREMDEVCPQGKVAILVTPAPPRMVAPRVFKRALLTFASCLHHSGIDVPKPRFGHPSPYRGLVFPLDWERPALSFAAKKCVPQLEQTMIGVPADG
jgi:hypothetical protein